jgi:sec-independent protein translocase protein TatA
MDLFGIGFGELALILVIALIVFGPGRLPEIARTIGRFSRNLKRMSSDFTSAMTKELDIEEEHKNLKKMSADLKTDMKTGMSLGDETRIHLAPPNSLSQSPPPTAPPPTLSAPTGSPALQQTEKHE